LLQRGIVEATAILRSGTLDWNSHVSPRGDYRPAYAPEDLLGCIDDPRVFALYEQLCQAIRDGTWQPGPPPGWQQITQAGGAGTP
jgi:hypothetical protein